MSSGAVRSRLTAIAGIGISFIFLWLAIKQISPDSMRAAFASITVYPLLLAGGTMIVGILLRAVRWLLLSGCKSGDLFAFVRATVLGVFFNFVFPLRAGELVRVMILHKLLSATFARVLSSSFVDRLFDITVLLAVATALYFISPIGNLINGWISGLIVFFGIVGLAIIGTSGRTVVGQLVVRRLANNWRFSYKNRPVHIADFIKLLSVELEKSIHRAMHLGPVIIAILILMIDYATITFVLNAFELDIPISAPMTLWVFLAAGSALPAVPGYVGVYQLASVWALSLYGIPANTAVAVAVIIQVTTLMIGGFCAAVVTLLGRWGVYSRVEAQPPS